MQRHVREVNMLLVEKDGRVCMVVNKLMYGFGALMWDQLEYGDLEIRQNGMRRWLWDVVNVRNELIRGEKM